MSNTAFLSAKKLRQRKQRKDYWISFAAGSSKEKARAQASRLKGKIVSEGEREEPGIPPSRIFIELEEMSSKQRKTILGLIKDLGFTPEEIMEVVVKVTSRDSVGGE